MLKKISQHFFSNRAIVGLNKCLTINFCTFSGRKPRPDIEGGTEDECEEEENKQGEASGSTEVQIVSMQIFDAKTFFKPLWHQILRLVNEFSMISIKKVKAPGKKKHQCMREIAIECVSGDLCPTSNVVRAKMLKKSRDAGEAAPSYMNVFGDRYKVGGKLGFKHSYPSAHVSKKHEVNFLASLARGYM